MFDAYTVKKVLPRLVIAVILIQLSWYIFSGMIFITNSIAYGVEALIYAPFGNAADFTFQNLFLSIGGSDLQKLFVTLVTVGAAIASFGGGIGAIALIAFLALFVGVLTLMIRRILLILLLLISPLALAAWILPGTERFWKMWWDNFTKLLMMYPIILAMIAVGRVMAKLGAGFDETIGTVMVLGGVFIPLALIPVTFKMAGSAFATIGGSIANRAQGFGSKRAAKARERGAKRWAGRGQKLLSGDMKERTAFGRRLNRIGTGIGVGAANRYGFGARGQAATLQKRQATADEAAKNNPMLQQLALNNDDGIAMLGLSGGTSQGLDEASAQLQAQWAEQNWASGNFASRRDAEADAANRAQRARAAARAVGVNQTNARAGFSLLAQNKARSIGAGNNALIAAGAARLAGGDADQAEALRGNFQFHARGAGRFDLGQDTAIAGFNQGSLYELGNGRRESVDAAATEHLANLTAAGGPTPEQQDAAAVFYDELQSMLPNTKGPVRDAVQQRMTELEAQGVHTYLRGDSGVIDPATGVQRTVQQEERFDPTNPAHMPGGARPFNAEDRARGWRTIQRNQTQRERLHEEHRVRTYRAPDDHNR